MGLTIGPLHVRRSLMIEAKPVRVWEEFSSLEHITAWLGIGQRLHRLDLEVGGRADLSVEIEGEERHFGGTVLIVEPERELSFESNWQPPYDWPVPTFWTIRLTPLYEGTLAEILHHGFERLGADAAGTFEGYEEGWTIRHLKALRAIVA